MKNFATTLEMNNSVTPNTHLQSLTPHLLNASLQFLASFGLFLLMLGRFVIDAFRTLFFFLARVSRILAKQLRAAVLAFHPLSTFSSICTQFMGEPVSKRQALHILNFSVSGLSALLFGGISVFVQLLLILWFVVSAWQCRMAVK